MRNGDNQRRLGRDALSEDEWEGVAGSLNLTPQQVVVVKGLFDNFTKGRIAMEMGRSPHTVDSHVRIVFARLNVSSQVQLVERIFIEHLALQEAGPGRSTHATP